MNILCLLGLHEKECLEIINDFGVIICKRENCEKNWLRQPPSFGFLMSDRDLPCNFTDLDTIKKN